MWDRGGKPGALVSDTPRTRHVLEHHGAYHKDTHVKHFGGAALAYVTPWCARLCVGVCGMDGREWG